MTPDTRRRRGPAPRDGHSFAPSALPGLRVACTELSWLLERGYSHRAALKLVGDRHRLTERQRKALQRTAAGGTVCDARQRKQVLPRDLRGQPVRIDGYNVLLTIESALSGGALLRARDGCMRDLAALSRHYKRLEVTEPALASIGRWLDRHGATPVCWYFDRPISNSGRLAGLARDLAAAKGWDWQVELAASPDRVLRSSSDIVATADSAILDACTRWLNLAARIIDDDLSKTEGLWIIDLAEP